MALYTKESRDRVRDAVDFVELVSARTELRRAGPARYEGLCPFHEERTPSFGIDPSQKVYYCFGCQASGDVFTFVQETEGVDFRGALELLAERYGVELQREQEDPREAERRRERERLLELLDRTAGYYERYLWDSKEAERAREYLQGRGLGEEVLREFRVGFAPSAWDRVLLASRRGGFTEGELYATGLAQRSRENGRPYDRFRSRITFPLADMRNNVVGFGARAMQREEQDADAGRRPKYLNTADNDVYHKGHHLYGAFLARTHAAKAGAIVLCEGYTDVIAMHQAGIRNTVGLMGTALTIDQVALLARMANTVLLALDADSAGQEAMLKASKLAAQRKLELRVVPLPSGLDPADLIQQRGAEAMQAALSESVLFARFRVERIIESGDTSTPEGEERILAELRGVFSEIKQGAVYGDLIKLASDRLATKDTVLEATLREAPAQAAAQAVRPLGRLSRRDETERAFLALCIATPEEGARALRELDVEQDFSGELLRRAAEHLRDGDLSMPMAGLDGEPGDEGTPLRALMAELVVQAGGEQPNPGMLEVQRLQLELARLERGIQRARGREGSDVTALARQRAELKLRFDRAYAQVLEQTGERAG